MIDQRIEIRCYKIWSSLRLYGQDGARGLASPAHTHTGKLGRPGGGQELVSPAGGGQGVVSPSGGGLKGEDSIQIIVSDIGPGIPLQIKDKIFQPFFTTKSTGKGVGLGLSLSYDIVKAHGGELKVESEEGIGTTLSIILKSKK